MKKGNIYKFILTLIFLFGTITFVNAQNGVKPPEAEGFVPPARPNLMQELGLSKSQIQQLRQINREWNPRRHQAQQNFKEAKRELDEAIYLDESNDSIINQRKEAVKVAHSELINTQTTMQTMIRRILTNDQLAKFRQLRQEFSQKQVNPNKTLLNPKNNLNQRIIKQQNRPLKNKIIRQNQRP